MKTYNFKVVPEPDEDFDGHPSGWHAYCPALERQGASTWGETEEEALKNINEVVRMVVESMQHHNDHIPKEPADQVVATVEPAWQRPSDPGTSTTDNCETSRRANSYPR
jgi:predicted RNase H-like HicB family nuclease